MTDLPTATGGADTPGIAAPAAGGSAAGGEVGPHKLVPGGRWQNFLVRGAVTGGAPNSFAAVSEGAEGDVIIQACPVTAATEWRRGTWERLVALTATARIVGCLEAQEDAGWRYEVMCRPPPTTLREWIACHRANAQSVQTLIRQISVVLGTLHAQGVVHLNLRPDCIYIEESGDEMSVVLGGLQHATLYAQPSVKLESADLFYAPPEAAGTTEIAAGTGLWAWDWWAVGRVMQEVLMGQHVMTTLFGSDVRKPTPELLAQAEALLLESEANSLRPGAVEAMTGLDPRTQMLMEGLLTASRDARWGQDAVQRWLRGDNVRTNYDLSRHARLFVWQGRGFTLPEAVEFFSTTDNWPAGTTNLIEKDNRETLAWFLSHEPEHRKDWEALQPCYELLATPAGADDVSPEVRQALVAGVAWLALAERLKLRLPLKFRGQSVDGAALGAWLGGPRPQQGIEILRGLTARSYVRLVQRFDSATGMLLERVGRVSREASRLAAELSLIEPEDADGWARLLVVTLETEQALKSKVTEIRAAYATCQNAALARLLAEANTTAADHVLLVYTAELHLRFGYVTRADWLRQQLQELSARRQRCRAAAFWLRLQRVLLAGSAWTGRWPVFTSIGLGAVVVGAFLAQDLLVTSLLALTLVGCRFVFSWQVSRLVRAIDPEAKPWTWRDAPARCTVELQRILPQDAPRSHRVLETELREIEEGIAKIEVEMAVVNRLPRLPRLYRLWMTLIAGTAALLFLAANFGAHWEQRLWLSGENAQAAVARTRESFRAGRIPRNVGEVLLVMPKLTPEMAARVVRGEYEIRDDGFGLQLAGPFRTWNFPLPTTPAPLPVIERQVATPFQQIYARVSGELVLASYGRRPINALVAIQVPTPSGFCVMIFNGRDRCLVDNQALLAGQQLAPETWYELERRRIIFLPSSLPVAEIEKMIERRPPP